MLTINKKIPIYFLFFILLILRNKSNVLNQEIKEKKEVNANNLDIYLKNIIKENYFYQIDTLFSTGRYIASFAVILKASYHAPM